MDLLFPDVRYCCETHDQSLPAGGVGPPRAEARRSSTSQSAMLFSGQVWRGHRCRRVCQTLQPPTPQVPDWATAQCARQSRQFTVTAVWDGGCRVTWKFINPALAGGGAYNAALAIFQLFKNEGRYRREISAPYSAAIWHPKTKFQQICLDIFEEVAF